LKQSGFCSIAVRGLERVRDLDPEVQQRGERERPAADPLRERLPLEQLHRDEVWPPCWSIS